MLIKLSRRLYFTICFLFYLLQTTEVDAKLAAPTLDNKFDNVRVNQDNFGKIKNMHLNWFATSIKALMGQLGKELYERLDRDEQRLLARCLDTIDDKKDLVLSARCLILARKRYKIRKPSISTQIKNDEWLGEFRVKETGEISQTAKLLNASATFNTTTTQPPPTNNAKIIVLNQSSKVQHKHQQFYRIPSFPYTHQWSQNLRRQKAMIRLLPRRKIESKSRQISSAPTYSTQQITDKNVDKNLNIRTIQLQPYDLKRKRLQIDLLLKRAKRRSKRNLSWFRQSEGKFGDFDSSAIRKQEQINEEPWTIKQADKPASLQTAKDRSPVSRITNLISMFVRTPTQNETDIRSIKDRSQLWSHTYKRLLKMKNNIDEKEKSPGAKAYNLRMYDLVLNNDQPTQSPKQSRTPQGLVQMAMDLFSRMNGDDQRKGKTSYECTYSEPKICSFGKLNN
ncbi:hypothetical protein M3Y97_00493200 [Aphelenchoides bicaudatus]|nr:hypothetical protein M3Y97_00493200 [Aphelenchoides bicaudatus]